MHHSLVITMMRSLSIALPTLTACMFVSVTVYFVCALLRIVLTMSLSLVVRPALANLFLTAASLSWRTLGLSFYPIFSLFSSSLSSTCVVTLFGWYLFLRSSMTFHVSLPGQFESADALILFISPDIVNFIVKCVMAWMLIFYCLFYFLSVDDQVHCLNFACQNVYCWCIEQMPESHALAICSYLQ